MDETTKEAFRILRPVCVELTKDQSRENVKKLSTLIQEVKKSDLQELQEYILFPLRIILKQSKSRSEELYTDVVNCLAAVISLTAIRTWEMFQDMFNSLSLLLASPVNQGKAHSLSEELKSATVRCLKVLTKQTRANVLERLYDVSFLPALGHCVSVLLQLARMEKLRTLQVDAMECLLELATSSRKVGQSLLLRVGDRFASFLPGISMTLCKIITGDVKQGTTVIVCALQAWSKVVALVMSDKQLEKVPLKTEEKDSASRSLSVARTEDWVKTTAGRLHILVQRIVGLVNHVSWKVRLNLVECAERVLLNCARSLEGCVPQLLEVLVGGAADEYASVSRQSEAALARFRERHLGGSNKTMMEMLEDNLHSLATVLPRVMRASDDEKKLSTLYLVNGYLKLLGEGVSGLVYSFAHLRRLSLALLQVLELDCGDIKIIEERSIGPGSSSLGGSTHQTPLPARKFFKHFTDERIHTQVILVCRTLGYYGGVDVLVEHFLDMFHQSSMYRKQSIMALNEIVMGTTGKGLNNQDTILKAASSDMEGVVRNLVSEYLSPAHWNLPTSNQPITDKPVKGKQSDWLMITSASEPSGVNQLNSNILQICLLLEGIGIFSQVLGENFRPLLMDVLYPVLERLGDETDIIRQTAEITALQIAQSCGYKNLSELVYSNADYLVNAISLRLRHLSSNPRTPVVLQVILQNSDSDILPLVEDTIQEILHCLDLYHHNQAVLFMRVLHALGEAVHRWFPVTQDPDRPPGGQNTNCTSPGSSCEQDTTQDPDKPSGGQNTNYKSPDSYYKQDTTQDPDKPSGGQNTNYKSPGSSCKQETAEEFRQFFLEYHKQKQIADSAGYNDDGAGNNVEEDHTDQNGNEEEEEGTKVDEEEKKEPPMHVKVIVQVLERCVHLLSSKNPRLRLLVLDTIATAAITLQSNSTELLPMIHKLWPPISQRFKDEEPLVVVKAFKTLSVISAASGDFLYRRFLTDVLPKTLETLTRLSPASLGCGASYRYSSRHQLQAAILDGIGGLCERLDLREKDLDAVLTACLPYLNTKQPLSLQQLGISAFQHLSRVDPDAVWLKLTSVCFPMPPPPPHSCFSPLEGRAAGNANDFVHNVHLLLEEL